MPRDRGDQFVLDDLRDVCCLLHRGGGDARHGLPIFLEHQGEISNGKNLGASRQAEIGQNFDASGAVEFDAEFLRERAGPDARSPEDVFRVDAIA